MKTLGSFRSTSPAGEGEAVAAAAKGPKFDAAQPPIATSAVNEGKMSRNASPETPVMSGAVPGDNGENSAAGICEYCIEFHQFLIARELKIRICISNQQTKMKNLPPLFVVEQRLDRASSGDTSPPLKKDQFNVMYSYLGVWVQR